MTTKIEKETLGERIHRARRAMGWPQWQLASELGVTEPTISGWEKGRLQPSIALSQIEELLSIPTGELEALTLDCPVAVKPGRPCNCPQYPCRRKLKFSDEEVPENVVPIKRGKGKKEPDLEEVLEQLMQVLSVLRGCVATNRAARR